MPSFFRESVLRVVRKQFPAVYTQEIMDILELYGTEPNEEERLRVQMAILLLSDGDQNKVKHYCKLAKNDYRDVLYWAEFTSDAQPIEDPYKSLLEED